MLQGVFNLLTNPKMVATAQNTKSAVSIETGLKAVGRPAFTMMDNNVDEKTKNYAATKEFLYQALCLGIYMLLIIPVFKMKTFGIYKKIFKDMPDFQKFKNAKEYLNYFKLATMEKRADRIKDPIFKQLPEHLQKDLDKPDLSKEELRKLREQKKEYIPKYIHAKGSIEFSSIIGSIVGLTILAPEISHLVLHPIMKAIGMEKKEPPEKNSEHINTKV